MANLPRRLKPTQAERDAVIKARLTPGALRGISRFAAPISQGQRVQGQLRAAAAAPASVAGVQFQADAWTLTAAGAQTKPLTYLPSPFSEHVYLNGVEQKEGTDWSRADQTLSVLTAMDARANDVLEVRYAYTAGAPIVPSEPLPNGLLIYIADDLALADGAAVSSWSDRNGDTTASAAQATSSLQPYYRSTAGPSGKAALDFGTRPSQLSIERTPPYSYYNAFAVVKSTLGTFDSGQHCVAIEANVGNSGLKTWPGTGTFDATAGATALWRNGVSLSTSSGAGGHTVYDAHPMDTWVVLDWTIDGVIGPQAMRFSYPDSAGTWPGHIAAIVLSTSALSSADQSSVRSFLGNYYGISVV